MPASCPRAESRDILSQFVLPSVSRIARLGVECDRWCMRLTPVLTRAFGGLLVAAGLAYAVAGFSRGPWVVLLGAGLVILGGALWWWPRGARGGTFDKLMVQPFDHRPADHGSAPSALTWWEARRPAYNVVVGAAGIMSGAISIAAAGISEARGGEPVGMPDGLFAVALPILFGVVANAFYTGGWIVELVLRRDWRVDPRSLRSAAFAAGLLFSLAIAALPALLATAYLLGLLTGVIHPTQYREAG